MRIFEIEENHWRLEFNQFGLDIILLYSESWAFWSNHGHLFANCQVGQA